MVSRILRNVPLGRLRLAELDDVPAIMKLVTESMALNFRIDGPSDVVYILETCILSICQLDLNETIVGFLALKDFPLVPSVNPAAWEDFVWTKFKAIDMNSRNTIFVHMLCWNIAYARDVVDSMLKSVFMHDPYLQFIGMMKMLINHQTLVPGQSRAEISFKRMQVLERGVPGDQLPSLWVADRKDVSPRLRIRRAVEEDNDDIVPIIERHSARLRELYGEFYVSELISRHPESERVLLVCEHKEVAVGVMCLNTQINYDALEENFELSPFAGLKHVEILPVPRDQDSVTSMVPTTRDLESQLDTYEDLPPKDVKSRVTWVFEEDEFRDVHRDTEKGLHTSCSQLDILNLLEDEDELEYDIVNIDKDLLRLPRLFTTDDLLEKQRYSEDSDLGQKECVKEESVYDNKYIESWSAQKLSNVSGNIVSTQSKPPEPTRYSGRPNAFLLEMFAMHSDYDERYGFDMLEAAYELFPDKDYCVMCLPSSHTCFPLLEHFTLVTPFSFRMRFINETLYVAHFNSIRGDVRVRNAEVYDLPHLRQVLEHAPRILDLLDLVEKSFYSVSLSPFVFLSQNQPIGVAVLGPLEDAISIRTQYDLEIESRRCGTDASILACVMSPIMEPHGRWYLRDMLRKTKYTTLFWVCRLFAKGDASPTRNLMSLASHMMPVRPRLSLPNYIGNKNQEKIVKDIATPFALWTIERPLTSLPKVHVNNSIVVVGASRTALSFLEALLLGPTSQYLTFTNITLVSQHGLPTVADSTRAADVCVPRDGRYSDRYLKSIPFYYYVDVMSAIMVKIDRKKKCIHLKGNGIKCYDELILTCGQQFQHPDYLKNAFEVAKEIENGKLCDRLLMSNPKYLPDNVPLPSELPENVMLINSLHEANTCLRKLKRMISDAKKTDQCLCSENKIVVYGACMEAYSCVAALLELGVKSINIAFVEPFPPEDSTQMRVNCFNNETIDERVQASIEKLGIKTYRQCYFHGWSLKESRIELVRLMSPLHAIHLPCFALFFYGIKAIDLNAFKAINECGLVYDGGLVVGPLFETNDPFVFGAGPCTKYSRRLYAQQYLHKYYSSEDVGEALAMLLLHKLDPFVKQGAGINNVSSEITQRYSSSLLTRWQPVMKFHSPLVRSATLPGPLHYMQICPPGKEVPMAVQLILPHQGHVLITDKIGNYFRLQINALHCVQSIACLSKKPFSCDTLAQLYGKHEAYFNNLLRRFNINLINDLFDYFTQPWIAALYQEQFSDLLYDVYQRGGNAVYEIIKTKFNELFGKNKPEETDLDPLSEYNISCETNCRECGQSEKLRSDASLYWRAINGEKMVYTKLTKYLNKNVITNMQYAIPEEDFV